MKIKRNSLCTCGSGKKYKKCCLSLEHELIQDFPVFSEVAEVCDEALAQIEAGNLLSAEVVAERLYNLYPDDYMVNFLLGVCHIQRNHNQKAISFFKEAVQLNPQCCEAYFNLANLFLQEKEILQSILCFKMVTEIEGIHGTIGKLAKEQLDFFDKLFQESSELTLDEYIQSNMLFDKAFTHLKNEEYPEAISFFKQVLTFNPNHVQSYGNMALAYSALGKQKIAIQYLDKALLLDPTYRPAQINRESILQLKEGEICPTTVIDVSYYKEKFESECKKTQKPMALT